MEDDVPAVPVRPQRVGVSLLGLDTLAEEKRAEKEALKGISLVIVSIQIMPS